MKQLVVCPSFPFSTQTFVVREVAETIDRGNDVCLLSPDDGDNEGQELALRLKINLNNVIYASSQQSPLLTFDSRRLDPRICQAADRSKYGYFLSERRKSFFLSLIDNPRLRNIDLIHTHFAGWAYNVALPMSNLLKIPFTVTAHDGHLAEHPKYILKELQFSAAAIALPSHAWKSLWEETTGTSMKLHVIPNAASQDAFNLRDTNRPTNQTIKILSISRLIKKKRIADAILAIKKLVDARVPCSYVIIGGGPEETNLRALTDELKIGHITTFLGAQPHSNVVQHLHDSDIFLHPSESESFGIAVIEAMAASLPVVATRNGGTADTVLHGLTGFLCDCGNVDGLYSALRNLSSSPTLRHALGAAGHERAMQNYSWKARMESMLHLWNCAITRD